jgi:predicted DNA-binding transcriptional regulator YafY
MYDDDIFTVELKCENSLMNAVIDNFGENVVVRPADCGHFIATVEVSANPPFYAWVFTFGGKIKILSPKSVVDEFKTHLKETLNNQ